MHRLFDKTMKSLTITSYDGIFEILDKEITIQDVGAPTNINRPNLEGSGIEFSEVEFGYPESERTLFHNLNEVLQDKTTITIDLSVFIVMILNIFMPILSVSGTAASVRGWQMEKSSLMERRRIGRASAQ